MEGHFGVLDYAVFGGMLLLSAAIGIYFAFFAKQKQNTTQEYLLGGRKIGMLPMSMSLIASSISGISILGYPSEMYTYGTQYYAVLLGFELSLVLVMVYVVPVLYNLQITSSYEYLEKRFSRKIRKMGSGLFILFTTLYMPVVVYVPALAFAQVSGLKLEILLPIVCAVCVFYTTVGGLKAVVWTDTLQASLILLGVATVSIVGTTAVGGVASVLEKNMATGRIEMFNMDLDPTLRHSFWTVFIGKLWYNLSHYTSNQSLVQRYLATGTLREAKSIMVALMVGMVPLISFCCYTGLVIFAAFADCDPVTTRAVAKSDQLLPYFVTRYTASIPGLPGVFLAGVFSAALSTMSTCLNAMTGVLFQDFIRPYIKRPVSEAQASTAMKGLVVVIGSITTVLAMMVDRLGGIIQTSASLTGITEGSLLGVYTLGMFFPWANAKGAFAGGVVSSLVTGWLCFGTQYAIAQKQITYARKAVSVAGCDNATLSLLAATAPPVVDLVPSEPFFMYKLSYLYQPVLGFFVCMAVGLLVSYWTGMNAPHKVDPSLLCPAVRRFIRYPGTDEDLVKQKLMLNNENEMKVLSAGKENGLSAQ